MDQRQYAARRLSENEIFFSRSSRRPRTLSGGRQKFYHPALNAKRDRHLYIIVFRGLKYAPADKSRSSGTLRLGKIAILGQSPRSIMVVIYNLFLLYPSDKYMMRSSGRIKSCLFWHSSNSQQRPLLYFIVLQREEA